MSEKNQQNDTPPLSEEQQIAAMISTMREDIASHAAAKVNEIFERRVLAAVSGDDEEAKVTAG